MKLSIFLVFFVCGIFGSPIDDETGLVDEMADMRIEITCHQSTSSSLSSLDLPKHSGFKRRRKSVNKVSCADDTDRYQGVELKAGQRIVTIGDLHGDYDALDTILRRTNVAMDGIWIGGNTILVQTGDIVDKGPSPVKIWYLFRKLQSQARAAGGDVSHAFNLNLN